MEQRIDPLEGKSVVKCAGWQRAAAGGELRVVEELPSDIWPHLLLSSEPQEKMATSQVTFSEKCYRARCVCALFCYLCILFIKEDPWQRSRNL